MKRILVFLLVLIGIQIYSDTNNKPNDPKAENSKTTKISLQESIELAVKNNKDIKISMLEYEKGKLDIDKAWKEAYFKVNYAAESNYFFKSMKQSLSNSDQIYGQSIVVSQPIYTGGAIKTGINTAKSYNTLQELLMNKTRKDVVMEAINAYIDVYRAENNLEVVKASEKTLVKNLEIQKEKYNLRLITKSDFLESERSVAEIKAAVVDSELKIELAKEILGNIIGVKNALNISIVPFTVEDKFTEKVILSNDLQRLEKENTEYMIVSKQREIADGAVEIEKSAMKPKVSGFVSYGTNNQDKMTDLVKNSNYSGTIGLNVSWQLFDWGIRKDNISKAEKDTEIYDVRKEDTLDKLKLGLRQVYYNLVSLEKSMDAKKIAMEKADEVYKVEKERYEYQLITFRDLLAAEAEMRNSKIDYINTRLNYYNLISKYGFYLD